MLKSISTPVHLLTRHCHNSVTTEYNLQTKLVAWTTCALLFFVIPGCSRQTNEVQISDAWIRPLVAEKTTTAGYVNIENNSDKEVVFTSASSETIGAIEFHISERNDGVHRMRRLSALSVNPDGSLVLEPGGKHLMLFRVQETEEDYHEITFSMKNGDSITHRFPYRENGT